MRHVLQSPRFINPFWYNQMKGTLAQGVAVSTRSVEVLGETLQLDKEETIELVPGERVHVALSRDIVFQTEQEKQTEEQERKERLFMEQLRQKEADRTRKVQADAFNAALGLPFGWVPGQKDVISGLREGSWGDGTFKNTVIHVLLQEDLHDGKLHRKAGMFLCSSSWKDNGKNWSGQPEVVVRDSNGELYRPAVTCKQCLKRAERWGHAK